MNINDPGSGFDLWLNDAGTQIEDIARRLGWEREARNFVDRSDSIWEYRSFVESISVIISPMGMGIF